MSSLNKVMLLGRLGQEPEVKQVGDNTVCTLSVATSYKYTKNNERVEKTEWHRVVVWGKTAEYLEKYATKGSQVLVEGSLQNRQWEDQQGVKRYTTEIRAAQVSIVSGYAEQEGGGGRSQARPANKSAGKGRKQNNNDDQGDMQFEDFGPEPDFDNKDEIPF